MFPMISLLTGAPWTLWMSKSKQNWAILLYYTSDFFLLMASLEAHLRLHLPHSIACKSIQHSSPAPFGDGSCCFIHIMTSHPKKVLTCLERSVLIVRKKCLPRFTRDTFQVLRVWPNCTSTPLLSSSNWGVRLLNLRPVLLNHAWPQSRFFRSEEQVKWTLRLPNERHFSQQRFLG